MKDDLHEIEPSRMSHPEWCEFVLLMPDATRPGRRKGVVFENLPGLRTLLLRRSPGNLAALSSAVDDCELSIIR